MDSVLSKEGRHGLQSREERVNFSLLRRNPTLFRAPMVGVHTRCSWHRRSYTTSPNKATRRMPQSKLAERLLEAPGSVLADKKVSLALIYCSHLRSDVTWLLSMDTVHGRSESRSA